MAVPNARITRRGVFGLAGGVAAAPLALGGVTPASAAGAVPDVCAPTGGRKVEVRVHVGEEVTLIPPSLTQMSQYPNSFAWDVNVGNRTVRKVLVGVNQHADDANADPVRAYFSTVDDGTSWQTLDDVPEVVPRIELNDGTILGFGYYTYIVPGTDDKEVAVTYAWSTDGGQTYETGEGRLVSERALATAATPDPEVTRAKISLHDRAFELADGTVCQPALATFAGDPKIGSVLLATSDRGQTWSIRSTIGYDPDLIRPPFAAAYEGLGEPNVVRLTDGSLFAVLRTGSWRPLYATRSTDDGVTWSPVEMMRAGAAAEHIPGINPKVRLLPNGVVVMMTGRDLVRLYVSPDGRGEQWQEPTVVSGKGYESGNGGMEILSHNRVLVIGDKRSNNRPGDPARPYHIWSRVVTVAVGPLHRLDLARAVADGTAAVTTDLDHAVPEHPGIGPSALYDGLVEYGRRAMAAPGTVRGTVTVDLGRRHRLTHVGIGGCERQQRFTIATSADGASWQQRHRGKHGGASVIPIAMPVEARWIRVTVDATRTAATMSELELYTEAITFTDEPVDSTPYGFTSSAGAGVDLDDDRGAVLAVASDTDGDPQWAEHTWGHGSAGVAVHLDLRAVAIPRSAMVFQLLGLPTTGLGASVVGVSIALRANGALQWWDGKVWNESHPAGTLSPDAWQSLGLECPVDRTQPPRLAIGGSSSQEIGYAAPLIWDFRTLKIVTSTSASAGQRLLIDNLVVTGL